MASLSRPLARPISRLIERGVSQGIFNHDPDLKLLYKFARKKSLEAVDDLGSTLAITRALATATVVNGAGLIESVAANTPRFDFDPVTKICKGLLVEEARTNLWLQSEDLSITWANSSSVDTQNEGIAPDGANTANKLADTNIGGTGQVVIFQSLAIATSTTFTGSVYAKSDGLSWFQFDVQSLGSLAINAYFDQTNCTVGATTGADNTSEFAVDFGAGWCSAGIVFASDAADSSGTMVLLLADDDNDNVVARDNTSSVLFWGAQLEAGGFPTSYIPTVASSVLRNKDDVSTSDVSGFSVTANTVHVKFRTGNIGQDTTVWSLHDGTANERIAVEITGGNIHFIGVDGGVTQWDISTAITADTEHQVAVAWAVNDIAFYLDGVQVGVDSLATLPTVTTLNICSDHANLEQLNSTMDEFRDYNVRKDNQFLEDLSNGRIPE